MATKKPNTYIEYDLEWLRKKIDELKQYVDDRPFDKLTDRIEWKQTGKGGMMPMVIQTIEGQLKLLKEILKDLPTMLSAVDQLEQQEEDKKKESRGGEDIPTRMQ